ncbi:MAG: transposase [Propionivibrio sp.]
MEIRKPMRHRRHHLEEFKQAVIAACCEPDASVAGIAMANGINANQVRRWMRERGIEAPTRRLPMLTGMAPAFVPVPIAPATPESPAIRIEIRRGNAAIKIHWPVQASGDCGAWLSDWLR